MVKQIIGVGLLLILAGIVVFNYVSDQSATTDNYDDQGDVFIDESNMPEESAGIQPGETAPDFELETLEGDTVRLSDLRGQKVILNFWATWCGPCREEMPEMQEFYDNNEEEVEILAVNLLETETDDSNAQEFIDEFQYTYPVLLDEGAEVSEAYKGSVAVPTTYFIGTDGTIQHPRKIGSMNYEFMEEMVETMD
ncbi:TlpA disulfide reductase family protein [Virgibacillus sp. YIM 98842]|uniref:TlpA disulfide reductase family protein n=1 Tax=Virgibacillus sp. YIM 98842 TaxID=2663533 RepID=UPI0013DCE7EF|nr:TlpA disulfide reductase family protein [Virgibacillus sp. YIM 98842]